MTATPFADAPGLRERVRALIDDVRFEKGMTALIVANAITLGLETSPAVVARIGGVLHIIDRTVLGVFVIELLSRVFVLATIPITSLTSGRSSPLLETFTTGRFGFFEFFT